MQGGHHRGYPQAVFHQLLQELRPLSLTSGVVGRVCIGESRVAEYLSEEAESSSLRTRGVV